MTLLPGNFSQEESGFEDDAKAARVGVLAHAANSPRAAVALSALDCVNWLRRLFGRIQRGIGSGLKPRTATNSTFPRSPFGQTGEHPSPASLFGEIPSRCDSAAFRKTL